MGWRKRSPGEGGGYLEDFAYSCVFWPVLVATIGALLVLSRHSRARKTSLRSKRVAGGTQLPHPGVGCAGVTARERDGRGRRPPGMEERWI